LVQVTISDQDNSTASSIFNLSGDETVTLAISSLPTPLVLKLSTYAKTSGVLTMNGGEGLRNLGYGAWNAILPDGRGNAQAISNTFTLYDLHVGTPSGGSMDGNASSQYVKLYNVDDDDILIHSFHINQYGLLGIATPAFSMPTTGTAVFNGEAYGQVYNIDTHVPGGVTIPGSSFVAQARADVNFATGAVTGTVSNVSCPNACASPAVPNFTMSFTATTSGAGFAGAASASGFKDSGNNPVAMTGNIRGGFYGPAANPAKEAGAVFGLTSSVGNLAGGFVAAR
jgi:hypothetical protein